MLLYYVTAIDTNDNGIMKTLMKLLPFGQTSVKGHKLFFNKQKIKMLAKTKSTQEAGTRGH